MSLTHKTTKLPTLLFLVVLTFSAGNARAEIYSEVEPNDTFANANFFPTSDGTLQITGTLPGGTVDFNDYFRFLASAGTTLQLNAVVTGFSQLQDLPGIRMRLLSPSGAVLAEDEDTGAGATATIMFSVLQDGIYGAALGQVIGCQCAFSYRLDISGVTPSSTPVPEPITVLLFGTGLIGVAVKVRRRV